jgi:hypothetical protein
LGSKSLADIDARSFGARLVITSFLVTISYYITLMMHSLILTTLNCMLQKKTGIVLRPKLETIYSVHSNVNTALSTSLRDDLPLKKTREMSFLHIFVELTWMPSGHDSLVPLMECAKSSHNRFSLMKHLVLRCLSCLDHFPDPMTQASLLPLESCMKVKGQVAKKLPRSIPVVKGS